MDHQNLEMEFEKETLDMRKPVEVDTSALYPPPYSCYD